MLPKTHRIADAEKIKEIFSKGSSFKTQHLIFRYLPKTELPPQFVVVVSKKQAKTAVTRNRIRRRTMDILRRQMAELKRPIWSVVQVKSGHEEAPYSQLTEETIAFFKTVSSHA